ncbi:hypothetical protein PPYR_11660 [Photinus pyralis]|uniref:C-factor n=2 Tax=Photinus pyralis TaxID=7054 RepID=A0A5N4ABY1_PHOPY|nr:hypothetical protein PPYR_11660 [Photinus pyralis]
MSPKFTRLNLVKPEQLMETYVTNTMVPILLTKALYPLLRKAAKINACKPNGIEKAAIINMSSMLGSFDLNTTGGFYPYRCSKVALNMATKSMSVDLKDDGIIVTSIHPGWVKTDLGGQNAPMEIDDSTSSIVKFVSTLKQEHSGGFYQWDGQPMLW